MKIAVYRNFLFYARCGAKDFFDKLKRADAALFLSVLAFCFCAVL